MERFTVHTGIVAVLDRDNVDTDQIIPKQFLKRIERTGYGDVLFFDWRFDAAGKPNLAFSLNAPQYSGASILLAGKNFGCGSSREHAVWALRDYGFRVVIAPSFADIFANNCVKNGVLTVALRPSEVVALKDRDAAGRFHLTVDLQKQEVSSPDGFSARFEIDPFRRTCLLEDSTRSA
ncbi:MAG TPA: 3-isopropylmalate dehydratase small subunit [Terracidiphilus sp.]|nr:3-isopropylmalate dehydratase small subunit [Terracidiphilus sp.]